MATLRSRRVVRAEAVWVGVWVCLAAAGLGTAAIASLEGHRQSGQVAGMPMAAAGPVKPPAPANTPLAWRLNNPAPVVVAESKANPGAVADKFAARGRSIEQRASLRAYEGAPPVIPHPIAGLNVETCRACHAEGLRAGDKTSRMVSHTFMRDCTQCHVEAASPMLGTDKGPANSFVGWRSSGYGGTRAWAGAPPVMPHSLFMRTNCVSCHGEFGYDGWKPDHLSRSNCVQCHASAAEFEQLSPTFGVADVADGVIPAPRR